jgi:hypothetical protein
LALAELYGSKLVAAMDRQHPRDLFDVMGMYERFGLNEDIVECFVCYLAGHNRPIHEVLFPDDRDLTLAYNSDFLGLVATPVPLNTLTQIRVRLNKDMPRALTRAHRHFLVTLSQGNPDWTGMACSYLAELPAIRWKLRPFSLVRVRRAGSCPAGRKSYYLLSPSVMAIARLSPESVGDVVTSREYDCPL